MRARGAAKHAKRTLQLQDDARFLGNSNDQDSGVVLKLAAAEIGDAVQQASLKRLGR